MNSERVLSESRNFSSKMLNRRHSSYFSYGSRQTTEQCWETIVIVCLQSIIGVMISATMAGIVFAKLARPKARSNTVMFSKNAVITQREGQLWLMFRLGNMRKSHLIESHLRAQLIHHRKTTKEGEILSYECKELPITTSSKESALTSAKFSNRNWIMSRCPWAQASCNGVSPSISSALGKSTLGLQIIFLFS